MTKKTLNLILIALAGMVFLTVGALTAADEPDEVMIQNKGYKRDKKGPVMLSHKKHSTDYKVACNECHHEYEDGKNVWKEGEPVKKCSECHDPKKKQGKTKKLKNAYHRNCKTCHKTAYDEGKKDAPYRKCNDCHSKEE